MKLLISLCTYNRLDYTKRTLRALWDTVEVPYYLVVVDNNSDDGTREYLSNLVERNRADKVILNDANYYPGKATNIGWQAGLKEFNATHLMRLDNDMHLSKGWDTLAEEYFDKIPNLGQLGIDADAIKDPRAKLREMTINGKTINPWPGCVGGPSIVRRTLYDAGLRYDETPWEGSRSKMQEDSRLSSSVKNMGYLVGHMTDGLCWTFANEANWKDYKDYYKKTMYDRGYDENVTFIEELE
ncbi:glycosyltransferase [Candidatus Saccharibacteria bacterium]|nr:glycosyltransferase [Candidatus Saccharibacteria bacterium]